MLRYGCPPAPTLLSCLPKHTCHACPLVLPFCVLARATPTMQGFMLVMIAQSVSEGLCLLVALKSFGVPL